MPICNTITNPNCNITPSNGTQYVNNVIQTAFSLFIVIGIIFFIWQFVLAGLSFINSQGDPKKIEEAKHQITYAFIGLIVIFSVFAILKTIGTIFGINNLESLQLKWPSL